MRADILRTNECAGAEARMRTEPHRASPYRGEMRLCLYRCVGTCRVCGSPGIPGTLARLPTSDSSWSSSSLSPWGCSRRVCGSPGIPETCDYWTAGPVPIRARPSPPRNTPHTTQSRLGPRGPGERVRAPRGVLRAGVRSEGAKRPLRKYHAGRRQPKSPPPGENVLSRL